MSSWLSRPAVAVKRRLQHANRFRNKHLLESIRCFSITENRNMKLLQFAYKDKPAEIRAGVLADDSKFIDVNKADPSLPCSTLDIVRCGHLEKVRQLSTKSDVSSQPLDSVILKAPITGVDKVLCIGLNYIDHCEEQNLKPPPVPMIFSKFASSLIGAGDVVKLRTDVTQVRSCMYCSHLLDGTAKYQLEKLSRIVMRPKRLIGNDALCFKKLQILERRRKLASLLLFYRFYHEVTKEEPKRMKLLQFSYKDKPAVVWPGVLEGKCEIIDICKADSTIPNTMLDIIRKGYLDKVKNILSENLGKDEQTRKHTPIQVSKVILRAPITGVDKVLCIGLNYSDHCKEQKLKKPPVPMVFSKFASCLIGSGDVIKLRTEVTKRVDWEVELAVVIGKVCTNVKAVDAYDYVLGYTVAQDISARDWQKDKNMGQFLLGKSMDTFCPIGPWIVTKDEIKDPQMLKIKCSLNGILKQKSDTGKLIHKIPDVIERLSSVMTLLPGDLILTGTPGGVGVHRKPPEFLKPGDVLTSEVQCIGRFDVKIDKF